MSNVEVFSVALCVLCASVVKFRVSAASEDIGLFHHRGSEHTKVHREISTFDIPCSIFDIPPLQGAGGAKKIPARAGILLCTYYSI
jgi:hypothetical protein